MNNNILFLKMFFILIVPYCSPLKTKLCIEAVIQKFLHGNDKTRGSISAAHPVSLPVGLGCHEIQEPAGLHCSPHFPNCGTWRSRDEPRGGDCLNHRTGAEEKWGTSFPLWVQNHSDS